MPTHVTARPSAQSWFVPLRGGMTLRSDRGYRMFVGRFARSPWPEPRTSSTSVGWAPREII
jgi:hypothetical protein